MLRLTSSELEQVKCLVRQGLSLNAISKTMNQSKTTIYHHFRRLRGRTVFPVIVNEQDAERVGEFIGLFAGDGYMKRSKGIGYRVILCFSPKEAQFVASLIQNVLLPLFNKKPYFTGDASHLNVCYSSKGICDFVEQYLTWEKTDKKTYSVRLRHINHSLSFIIGFLRGSLDSDGYFSPTKILFGGVSYDLMMDIQQFLRVLGIAHSLYKYVSKRENRKDLYHVYVLKKHREKFISLIRPRNWKSNAPTGN